MNEDVPILALLVYGKNQRDDLSSDQRKTLAELVTRFKKAARAA